MDLPGCDCGIVCGNNPLIYTDPGGHFRLNLGRFFRNVEHAVAKNWRVIASVAISAVAFYAAGELIVMENAAYATAAGEESFFTGVPSAAIINYVGPGSVAAIHAGAGAIAGGLTSAINHGNIGLGVLTGGISAGVAEFGGSLIPNGFGYQLAGRAAIGATTGGITSSIYGGNFWKGLIRGAETSAAGFLFNHYCHEFGGQIVDENGNGCKEELVKGDGYGKKDWGMGVGLVVGVAPFVTPVATAEMVYYGPSVAPMVLDFVSGLMPGPPSSLLSSYGNIAGKSYDFIKDYFTEGRQ